MKAIRNLLIPFGLIIGLTVDGFEQPRPAGTPMAAIHVANAWGGTAVYERVPFVGCESTDLGGGGDREAPKDRGQAPVVPQPVAHALAYYASAYLGVLAPRDWHCRGYERSDSSTLTVTPEPFSADSDASPAGPAIFVLFAGGWTGGGASLVADVAARLFPAKKKFVLRLIHEWGMDKSDYTFGPYPDDILTRRNDSYVEYETPANKDGMGTRYGLVMNADPIRGLAKVYEPKDGNGEAPSLVLLEVRLPPGMRPLVQTIMKNTGRPFHQ